MASITISLASGTTGKLYATASSILHTRATQPSSSITITCDASGTTGADITLREATDGSHITNCPMLAIRWKPNGYTQEVLFGSSTANKPMAQFKYGSTTISYSTTTVPAGGTITVTALAGSGTADTTAPSDVGIGGYYYAHNGLGGRYNYSNGTYTYEEYTTADSNQGIRSKPARCGNRVPVDISFKYNGTAKYFVFMMMRGWAGASAGCPGDMGMLAGTGPIVNSTFQTGWADGYDTYRIDVFALSPSGIYPSPANMPGDGSSQTSCPSNSTWVKWPEDSSLSTYNVTYYGTDGSTILRSNTEAKLPLQFTKVSNSAITFYKGTELYKYLSGDSGTLVIPSGKRFKGWQKKVGSGSYGSVITTASGMGKVGTSNVSLKLVVEDDTVDISFKSNYPSGSSGSTADRTQSWVIGSSQSLLSAPSTPTKTGYTYAFAGWYTAASGGTKVGDAGSSYTVPSSNTTLYAHWTETAVKYTITYNSNGGSSVSPQDYYITTNLTLASAPSKIGYTFSGWKSTTTTGGWSATTYSASQNVGTGHSGNITLVAQYNPINYTITYNNDSSSLSYVTVTEVTSPSTYNIETPTISVSNPSVSPNGYRFLGWTGTTDGTHSGSEDWSTASTSFKIRTGSYGNVSLTAHWEPVVFTVSFDTNLGEYETHQTQSPVETPSQISVTFGTKYRDVSDFPNWSRDVRYGYKFDGWYTEPSGGTEINNNTVLTIDHDHTLYAHWTIKNTSLIFDTKGGSEVDDVVLTIEESYPYYIIQTTSKLNNVFVGWFDSSDNLVTKINSWPSSDITLYAKFIPQLTPFEPKPDKPGIYPQNPSEDNDNYGIPVEDLDSSLQYRLVLTVKGDRENGTHGEPDGQGDVFTMPSGTGSITRDSNNHWVWSYDTGIVSKQDLYYKDDDGVVHGLMIQTIFTMNVWRVQVHNSTAVLDVTLEAYDDGNSLGSSETHNEFEIGDEYVPYVSKEDSGINSDVLLLEGIDSIRSLDLYNAIGSPQDLINAGSYEDIKQLIYTRRFIGNSRSTVVVRIKAHSKNFDPNSELYEKEVLYGAVPCYITVRLDGDGYDSDYVNEVVDFNPNDEDNHVYVSPEITVDTHPFPNIVHSSPNDFVSGRFRIKVYDSRHYHVN